MKKILIGLFLLAGVGAFIGYKMYNKPHEDIEKTSVDFAVDAVDLFSEFDENETIAGPKYNDKIIEVSGEISAIDKTDDGTIQITLEAGSMLGGGVICQMGTGSEASNFQTGNNIKLKGKCTGFLSDVILVRCVVVK